MNTTEPKIAKRVAIRNTKRTSAPPESPQQQPEIVLLAVAGMSPGIITETIWALAHPQNPSERPLIPDRVVAVTTTVGRRAIVSELFEKKLDDPSGPCVWDALRAALAKEGLDVKGRLRFGNTGDNIRIFPDRLAEQPVELDDIRTRSHNEAAADFILDQVLGVTEIENTQLIASLAGGRKTMGALLYAVMSLLGRPQDGLTHVLVNKPFEEPGLQPKFYFPGLGADIYRLLDRAGNVLEEHPGASASIELATVPFLRLRRLVPQHFGRLKGRFNELVRQYERRLEEVTAPPAVNLGTHQPTVTVEGRTVLLGDKEFALFCFLAERCAQGAQAYEEHFEAVDDFRTWLKTWGRKHALESFQHQMADEWEASKQAPPVAPPSGAPPADQQRYKAELGGWQAKRNTKLAESFRKHLSSMRAKFVKAGLERHLDNLLPPKHGRLGINVILENQEASPSRRK